MRTAATLPARALVLVLVAPGEGILDVAVHDPAGVTCPPAASSLRAPARAAPCRRVRLTTVSTRAAPSARS